MLVLICFLKLPEILFKTFMLNFALLFQIICSEIFEIYKIEKKNLIIDRSIKWTLVL